MMLEISCPSCKAGYFVDEGAAGAEFVCPCCTTAFALPVLAAVATPPQRRGPAGNAQCADPKVASRIGVAARTVDQPEIVCPRCNLHFSPSQRTTGASSEARPTVLVVEEPGFFLKIAQEALSGEYEVLTASRVADAQTLLANEDVDLLVLDLGVEGPDSGRALLPGPFAKHCPVLIYSADDESETFGARWEELQELGADDIVMKGMHVAESLYRKVGALLGRPSDDEEDTPA